MRRTVPQDGSCLVLDVAEPGRVQVSAMGLGSGRDASGPLFAESLRRARLEGLSGAPCSRHSWPMLVMVHRVELKLHRRTDTISVLYRLRDTKKVGKWNAMRDGNHDEKANLHPTGMPSARLALVAMLFVSAASALAFEPLPVSKVEPTNRATVAPGELETSAGACVRLGSLAQQDWSILKTIPKRGSGPPGKASL